MDVSPSRINGNNTKNSTVAPTIRRENSKTIPKLSGEQIFKQKIETKSLSDDVSSDINPSTTKNATAPIAGQTKIPMKRTPISTVQPKTTVTTPRSLQRPQMRSASKISLTIKEIGGGRKLETNASKLSFKGHALSSMKSTLPASKCLTARGTIGPGISRRSASTISCRSLRSPKNEENIPTLPKVNSCAGDHETHLSARERVAENNKLKVFENLHKKLLEMQSDFMQKYESIKTTAPEKLKTDFKFITMVKNNECKLVVKDDYLQRLPKKLPAESIVDLKEKIKFAMDHCLMTLMESLKNSHCIKNEQERVLNLEDTHNRLEKEQSQKLSELYEYFTELCATKDGECDMQIVKMQKEIQESKKALQNADKKINELKKVHSDETETLEKGLKEKCDADIIKRDTQIAELNKKLRNMEKHQEKLKNSIQQSSEENINEHAEKAKLMDELKACRDNIHTLTKKLTHSENQLTHEKKDKSEKIEHLKKLSIDLESAKKAYDELQLQKMNNKNSDHHDNVDVREYIKEISQLKTGMESLERDKHALECTVEKMRQECNSLCEMRSKLKDAENKIQHLQQSERDLDDRPDRVEYQGELTKLRQSETEKRREIEKLKVELSKAHFNICQLEEQIQRDQQLLEVRSELINSLQTNDNSQRIHLEELFAQVGEKNNTINEVGGLNTELRTKSEEFRNLFTTLSTKQMELSRQEHMIKLLEESNERSQMLRVKQEEKIGRMEEEIAHLKQTVSIYQNNVLGNAGCKNLLFSPVAAPEDYNENFYYYTSERRRKRQVDINVKKYET